MLGGARTRINSTDWTASDRSLQEAIVFVLVTIRLQWRNFNESKISQQDSRRDWKYICFRLFILLPNRSCNGQKRAPKPENARHILSFRSHRIRAHARTISSPCLSTRAYTHGEHAPLSGSLVMAIINDYDVYLDYHSITNIFLSHNNMDRLCQKANHTLDSLRTLLSHN